MADHSEWLYSHVVCTNSTDYHLIWLCELSTTVAKSFVSLKHTHICYAGLKSLQAVRQIVSLLLKKKKRLKFIGIALVGIKHFQHIFVYIKNLIVLFNWEDLWASCRSHCLKKK